MGMVIIGMALNSEKLLDHIKDGHLSISRRGKEGERERKEERS